MSAPDSPSPESQRPTTRRFWENAFHSGPPGQAPADRGDSPRGVPTADPAQREAEHRAVLAEIDTILRLLGVDVPSERTSPAPRTAVAPSVVPSPEVPSPAETSDRWGAPSPYLDERLANARVAAAGIFGEFDSIQRRTRGLGEAVATLKVELDRASEELAFLRSNGLLESIQEQEAVPAGHPTRPVAPEPEESPIESGEAATLPAAEVYEAFTLAQYNDTMRDLRERRRRVGAVVLVLAAVISAALVAVTYLAHEPTQPWWLAALPFIWMIPVPFFVASFRGTHRVLKETRFELPEAA
jgi:hypothetical protein